MALAVHRSLTTAVVVVIVAVVLTTTIMSASAQTNCQGRPNYKPIFTSPPVLVNTSTNGKLYKMRDVEPPLWIMHAYGSPYDMGFAQGTLLREQISALVPDFYDYVYSQMEPYLQFLPPNLRHAIEELGVAAALDLTYELTKPYIPPYFLQELQGMADGSGVPYQQLLQVQMFPELIKAGCSMYGAWDQATANATSPGRLFQLRALDWGTNGPFQKYPVVTVYHPDSDNGHAFAIVAWTGFIGAITGYSSAPVGICEKVWLGYNGTSSRRGIPWHFLLRDILQFDVDINSAITRMADATRTCAIWVGVGDQTNRFVAVGYSHETVDVYDNINSPTWSGHPKLPDLVYIDKHVQPSSDPCMGSLMQKYYGTLDSEIAIRQVAPVFQTGDMHVAVYDYAMNYMYVANASPANATGGGVIPAYDRPYVRLSMAKLFAEPAP